MNRWLVLILLAFVLSCNNQQRSLAETLPANIEGWTRSQLTPLSQNDAPEIVRQLGLEQAASATYNGPTSVSVNIFKMKGQTSAFELIQKWRQSDGLAVYSGPYFMVADPAGGPDAGKLLQALQKNVK